MRKGVYDVTIQGYRVASPEANGLGSIFDGDGLDAGVTRGAADSVLSPNGILGVIFPVIPTVGQQRVRAVPLKVELLVVEGPVVRISGDSASGCRKAGRFFCLTKKTYRTGMQITPCP